MPRKGHIAKRDVLPDPIYNNKVVTKLINNIMLDGKKGVAQRIVYGAFERVAQETGKDALEVFNDAMNNIMPALEVKSRRIGGATYQVPIDVRPDRRQTLALRWITLYSRKRGERTMEERLAKDTFRELQKTIKERKSLNIKIANAVANAMKDWAVEHGATHYTHWFQPMTGVTAEKHDGFIGTNKNVIKFL